MEEDKQGMKVLSQQELRIDPVWLSILLRCLQDVYTLYTMFIPACQMFEITEVNQDLLITIIALHSKILLLLLSIFGQAFTNTVG